MRVIKRLLIYIMIAVMQMSPIIHVSAAEPVTDQPADLPEQTESGEEEQTEPEEEEEQTESEEEEQTEPEEEEEQTESEEEGQTESEEEEQTEPEEEEQTEPEEEEQQPEPGENEPSDTDENESGEFPYSAKGQVVIEAQKVLKGRPLKDKQFTFELYDSSGRLVGTACNSGDGSIKLPAVEYTRDDMETGEDGGLKDTVITYTLKEKNEGKPGYTYSDAVYTIHVTLHDNKDGRITATPDKDRTALIFKGQYKAKGEIRVEALLKYNDGILRKEKIPFVLYDENSGQFYEASNNEQGRIVFEAIKFTQDDIYTADKSGNYTGSGSAAYEYQVFGADIKLSPEISRDSTIYCFEVLLKDKGDGTISTQIKVLGSDDYNTHKFKKLSADTPMVFTYQYHVVPTPPPPGGQILAKLVLRNGELRGGEFTFVLKDENGKILMRESNDASGNVSFDIREYSFYSAKYGSIRYTLSQETGNRNDIDYDGTVYNITVSAEDNYNYTIDKGGTLIFTNEIVNLAGPGEETALRKAPGTYGIKMLSSMALKIEQRLKSPGETGAQTGDEGLPAFWSGCIVFGLAGLAVMIRKQTVRKGS